MHLLHSFYSETIMIWSYVMSIMIVDCPHCFKRNNSAEMIGIREVKLNNKTTVFSLVGFCSDCNSGIAINAKPSKNFSKKMEILSIIQKNDNEPINSFFDEEYTTFPAFPSNKYIVNIPIEPTEIAIEYKNSKGELSNRRIRVNSIECNDKNNKLVPQKLDAYCLERKMPRNFIIKRIMQAYNADSGEIIDDIYSYLVNKS